MPISPIGPASGVPGWAFTPSGCVHLERVQEARLLHARNSRIGNRSPISAPAGWIYFAPFPSLIDDLNYISLDVGTDVPIGGSLGGFSFVSALDPDSIDGDDFHVEGIGADSASQIDLGNAQLVPEPATAVLLLSALAGLGAWRRAA